MNLPALGTVANILGLATAQYKQTARFCDQTFATLFPGGAAPNAAQQASTIAAVTAMGVSAATLFAGHFAFAAQVLAYEAANGMTVAHAWASAGAPAMPKGWTSTPVLDGSGGNPTGALTLAYTAPTS